MQDPSDFQRTVDTRPDDVRVWIGEPGRILPVSGTVGCAWASDVPGGREDLMRCADMALYSAKTSRKGTASVYVPPARVAAAS